MEIGKRIYSDELTGQIIVITGEYKGEDVSDLGIDHDFVIYQSLSERVRDSVHVTQLEVGQYEQDFREGRLTGIHPTTKELLFSYPDPATKGESTPPEPPLSDKVKTLESDVLNTRMALADTYEQLLSAQAETTSMQLALVDVYEQLLAINT